MPEIRFHDEAHVRRREDTQHYRLRQRLGLPVRTNLRTDRRRMRERRLELGLSLLDVAVGAGIARRNYIKIEGGATLVPTADTRAGIAATFGLRHDDLFKEIN